MKQTRSLMGMHITVEVVDENIHKEDIDTIYEYFAYVDEKFSTYIETSEISQINKGVLSKEQYSSDMKKIFLFCEETKRETNGYFDILHQGKIDPSGIVKGWAILEAAELLKKKGFKNFYVDAGGDIQVAGINAKGKSWTVGIRNPFNHKEIVKIVSLDNCGIATSGTAERGRHIYNPHNSNFDAFEMVSFTVIGPNVYEADRFATAAFAMGAAGVDFIENRSGFEAYMIDKNGIATYTSGFNKYVGDF